ncbi:MAG: prepilin-type N-terminal cleavage/methylation domain-containing protein [Verrucomicrobiota bacterium]|nr:prepilin-type N-terminal cleavage/methylation domain-containing protein [Verrucomicrobiota bacterium]
MCIAQVRRVRRGAFTLLEITLAVAILAMMSMAIYRFVASNLTALRISADANVVDARYSGFLELLTAQLQDLPAGVGALTGEPLKLDNRSRDEMTWVCGAGPGLLTRYAAGEYRVSLRLRPATKGGDKLEIGLARRPKDNSTTDGASEDWAPLLANVQDLQIRYFDPRLNTWVDRWSDAMTLPRLVKVTIGRLDSSVPWESIVALGRTPLL